MLRKIKERKLNVGKSSGGNETKKKQNKNNKFNVWKVISFKTLFCKVSYMLFLMREHSMGVKLLCS